MSKMNQKQADRIVNNWIEVMNCASVYAEAVMYDDEWYMFSRGTGDGDFLYELDDVRIWLEETSDNSYQDFCEKTFIVKSPIEMIKHFNRRFDLDLCRNGTCDFII